jgi:hypothetical protein
MITPTLTCIQGGVEIRRDLLLAQTKATLAEIASRSELEQKVLRDMSHPRHRDVLASVIDAVLAKIPSTESP